MTPIERYRIQFANLTPNRKPEKPMTGIQRAAQEEEETNKFWNELEKFNR